MEKERLEGLSNWFERYALSYANGAGVLPKAMECKLVHTREVRSAAARIASSALGAKLQSPLATLAECGGLLHDVARFEQYRLHNTFADRKSFDHGDAGARMIVELKLDEGLPADEAKTLLDAVRLHNKMVLPEGLSDGTASVAKVVRDADKVAIIHFIARYLNEEAEYWNDPAISLEAPDTGTFNFELAKRVLEGGMVLYSEIRCKADFLISLFAWPVDLNYAESARMLLESGAYHKIGRHLPPAPIIDEMMDASSERILKLAGMGEF